MTDFTIIKLEGVNRGGKSYRTGLIGPCQYSTIKERA